MVTVSIKVPIYLTIENSIKVPKFTITHSQYKCTKTSNFYSQSV